MLEQKIKEQYHLWLEKATLDIQIATELLEMKSSEAKIEDAFYRDLEFGTGGLRGKIGAGTNRMNIYTVAKASQGLANYVIDNFEERNRKIAIAFDSRINSDVFAKVAAEVFSANNIGVHIFRELMPTPCLSFAVRELKCSAGIVITASHNPAQYNGYKVYGKDGCQITTEMANAILENIQTVDIFKDVHRVSFDESLHSGGIKFISEDIYTLFTERVKMQSMLQDSTKIDKNVSIVYSPLNGAGKNPVVRVLQESGYHNIHLVREQENPDGDFTTCPYPNPEEKAALELSLEYAKKENADLVIATDPDCDRVGIAVKNKQGEYQLLTGNETGVLLFDYICSMRINNNMMPQNPVMIKTIVTSEMAEKIADYYNVRTINVLTGFKFIGEQIGLLEAQGLEHAYIFGFEESYGYLSGTYARDKDAVNGAFLICEMFAYYKTRGINLLDKLEALYNQFGYFKHRLLSYTFEGSAGFSKMQDIMKSFRENIETIGANSIIEKLDYSLGIDNLPKSDVLKFGLENGSTVVIRLSGTEPKLKAYITVCAKEGKEEAFQIEDKIVEDLNRRFV